jgi:hypothetical protein
MLLRSIFWVAILGLAGCPNKLNDNISFGGFTMTDFFPFDGERTWEFVSEDIELDYILVADLLEENEVLEDGFTRVYTIEYSKDCISTDNGCVEGEYLRNMRWASNDTYGTFLYGYELAGEDAVAFDPPLQITTPSMKREDSVTTDTGGNTWTSTFVQLEACPVQWAVDWDECARFELDDGDGDLSTGSPVSGTFWVITGYNMVAMDWPGEAGRWELLKHIFSP